jgi:hypothetical protein
MPRTPKHPDSDSLSGLALLADFQSAFMSAATIEAAHFEAERSENELLSHLTTVSGNTYLNPGNLETNEQSAIARASLDAHIKKIQARQLGNMSADHLQQQLVLDRELYKGKRIRVTILKKNSGAVESVWLDRQTGYRQSAVKYGKVSGIIEEVLLDRNMLVLKTTIRTRLLASSLRYYVIYPIDPANLMPAVSFELL